jgi:hypothetical protein
MRADVAGLGDDGDALLRLEHERRSRAHDRVVAGDHEPDLDHGTATP